MSRNNQIQIQNDGNKKKFIVLDIVFYGSSLNYDWGGGANYQPLKKITKWDGRQYILVSRYALRYSILHWANHLFPNIWKLAGSDVLQAERGEVVRLRNIEKDFLNNVFKNYPEFDLFGFMVAEKGSEQAALTRTSPVKISHAVSLTPYSLDSHTMANLDMMRRAGGKGSNPVTTEEKADFYVYNVTIDVDRIGKFLKTGHGEEKIGDILVNSKIANERIISLIETILNLKRDIKGRREDLSPWLIVLGLYNNGKYESYFDKIRLERKSHYKIKRTIKKEGETEVIEHEIEEDLIPSFFIDIKQDTGNVVKIFYRENLCEISPKYKNILIEDKEKILKEVKNFLGIEEEKGETSETKGSTS